MNFTGIRHETSRGFSYKTTNVNLMVALGEKPLDEESLLCPQEIVNVHIKILCQSGNFDLLLSYAGEKKSGDLHSDRQMFVSKLVIHPGTANIFQPDGKW